MSNRFVLPFAVATDPVNGVPLSGGKLFFYKNKTATKKDTYKDADLTTPHENPVIADSGGYFPVIYTDGIYTVRLTDSDEVQIDEEDNYEGPLFEAQSVVDNKLTGDPPSATDSGTDDYEADFGRDVADGIVVLVDFSSANTTTTPTLENTGGTPAGALTVTTKDGSALWANALSGVHELQYDSSGPAWRVVDPNPSSQVDPIAYADSVSGEGEKIVGKTTLTGASEVDIDLSGGNYSRVVVSVFDMEPVTDAVHLYARVQAAANSSPDSGASDYAYRVATVAGTADDSNATNTTKLTATEIGNNSALEHYKGTIEIVGPRQSDVFTRFWNWSVEHNSAANVDAQHGGGFRRATQDDDLIRLYFQSGNIASITYEVWGYVE